MTLAAAAAQRNSLPAPVNPRRLVIVMLTKALAIDLCAGKLTRRVLRAAGECAGEGPGGHSRYTFESMGSKDLLQTDSVPSSTHGISDLGLDAGRLQEDPGYA